MWKHIAVIVLRNRISFIIGVALFTIFMGYKSQDAQLGYKYAALLPKSDSTYINLMSFKEKFGQSIISPFKL